MSVCWINVRTRELDANQRRDWSLSPNPNSDPNETYFPVSDPFNTRKAVIPLFDVQSNGTLSGLGTAFGISASGLLLTADHVVSDFRRSSELKRSDGVSTHFELTNDRSLVAFLSPGLIYGTMHIPQEYLPHVISVHTPTKQGDDPMKDLRGEPNFQAADVSVLRTQTLHAELNTLQFQPAHAKMKIGDRVVAVGFPQLDVITGGASVVAARLQEGMYASYGTVKALHPDGRDQSNQTPVFEVNAHWPSGMSGGPVFNESGEVVGLVSRSLERCAEHPGVGWATWIARLPEIENVCRHAIISHR